MKSWGKDIDFADVKKLFYTILHFIYTVLVECVAMTTLHLYKFLINQ